MAPWPTEWSYPISNPGQNPYIAGPTRLPGPPVSGYDISYQQIGRGHERHPAQYLLDPSQSTYQPQTYNASRTAIDGPLSPEVLHIRSQLSETQSQLSDAISERIRTPDSQALIVQELSGKIERLKHEMSLQALALKQQAEKLYAQDLMLLRQAEVIDARCDAFPEWQDGRLQTQGHHFGSQFQDPRSSTGWPGPLNQYPPPPKMALSSYASFDKGKQMEGTAASTPPMPRSSQQRPFQSATETQRTPATPRHAGRGRNLVNDQGSPIHQRNHSQLSNPFQTPNGSADHSSNGVASNENSVQSASSKLNRLPELSSQNQLISRPRSTDTTGMNSIAPSTMSSADNMRESFQELIDNAVAYAHTYVNWPTTAGDKNLPQHIKDIVKEATHPKHAHRLIKTPETRFYVVSKIILAWMWKVVFHPESFFGLDPELERVVRHHRAQLNPENCAPPVRYVHLSHIAAQFQQLRVNHGYSRHIKMLIGQRATDLFQIIQPLAHLHKPGEWEQFYELMKQAHKVAEAFFGGHAEYWWRFPDMRDQFCVDTMSNIDKSIPLSPAEVEERHIRVRVAATPHVRARKTHKDGRTMQLDLIKASVLPNYIPQEKWVDRTGQW